MKQIFFRVDGGLVYSVAMGHVARCLKIARALKKRHGIAASFIMKHYPEGVAEVGARGFEVITLDTELRSDHDAAMTAEKARGHMLVIDVRHYSPENIASLRKACSPVIVFDDLGNDAIKPDVIINPAVVPEHRRYTAHAGTAYCLGPAFFVFGENALSPVSIKQEVRKIVISLGGADPARYTEELARKIYALGTLYDFTFVLGQAYGDGNGFRCLLEALPFNAAVVNGVENLPAFFQKFDMAIVAGGDTCLELAHAGIPGMIVPTISYEEETALYLASQHIFINLGDIKKRSSEEIQADIAQFAGDYEKRNEYAQNGRALIDGQGLARVLEIITGRLP